MAAIKTKQLRKIFGLVLLLLAFAGSINASPAEAQKRKSWWEERQLEGLTFRAEGYELYHNALEREQFKETMTQAILNHMAFCKRRMDDVVVKIRSCRKAYGGCEARIRHFVGYILDASDEYNVNPWLLAAMSYNESRFNPFAVGPTAKSKGILQLNPRTKRGKRSKFVQNKRFRDRCKRVPGNCQREIVFKAADHIDSAVRYCGSLTGGLSMYNSGRCGIIRQYIRNTSRAWRSLQMNNGEKEVHWCDRPKKNKRR